MKILLRRRFKDLIGYGVAQIGFDVGGEFKGEVEGFLGRRGIDFKLLPEVGHHKQKGLLCQGRIGADLLLECIAVTRFVGPMKGPCVSLRARVWIVLRLHCRTEKQKEKYERESERP